MPVDSTGVFRFFNLPPGQYAVGVFYSNLPIGSGASLYPNTAQPKIFTVSGGEDYRSVDFTIPAQASFSISGAVAAPSVAAVRPAPEFVVALGLPEAPWIAISQVWTQNGKFQFEKVPSGVYDLYASGPTRGYGAYEAMLGPKPVFGRTRVTVSGQNIPGLEVLLSPGLAISLEARGADSEKLPAGCPRDIPVTLTSLEPWAAMLTKSSTAQVGAGVKVEDLAPGRYRISARVTGDCFSAAETEFDARTLTAPVSVPVAAGGQLRGLLKGAAKPGAFHVTLLSNSTAAATPVRFAYTDAQGRFTFDALPPGPYRLAIQPTLVRPRRPVRPLVPRPRQHDRRHHRRWKPHRFRTPRLRHRETIGATMRLVILALFAILPALAQTPAQDPTDAARFTIGGTVRDIDSGAPLPNYDVSTNVRTTPPGGRPVSRQVRATSDSASARYELKDLPAGSYSITARNPEVFAQNVSIDVALASESVGDTADLRIPVAATVSGRVFDDNKEPVPDVRLVLVDREYFLGSLGYFSSYGAVANDLGEYTINNIPSGRGFLLLVEDPTPTTRCPRSPKRPSSPSLRRPVIAQSYYPKSPQAESALVLTLKSGEHREAIDLQIIKAPSYCISGVIAGRRFARPLRVPDDPHAPRRRPPHQWRILRLRTRRPHHRRWPLPRLRTLPRRLALHRSRRLPLRRQAGAASAS